ncbi:hypothetical protein Tco_0655968 [Tanacetum coccineum]|uniref:Uncharacterized protein n=1 Tax=Tanacetum coccineum TaxID=301880 RepID=A0ABQ4X7H6_9ASTR
MSANDNFSLHDDEELSLHDDASLNGSEPVSNKGDAPAKPPQIITTNTLSNIKLPVLQKDDYDTWAMEMEHYLEYIDNEVWKVIQNGNSKKRVTKGKDGVYRVLPPTTQAEQVADEKERKARTLLLMAVPKDHLRRFHGMEKIMIMPKRSGQLSRQDKKLQEDRECKFKGTKDGSRQEANRGQDFKPVRTEKEALMTIDEAKYDELQSEFGDQEAALTAHKIGLGYSIKSNAEVLSYEEEMDRGIFASIRETDPGYHDIPLYSRFKQVEYKEMRNLELCLMLSSSFTQPSINDSDGGELGTVTDHSVNDDPISTQKTQSKVPTPTQTVDPSCAQHVKHPHRQLTLVVHSMVNVNTGKQNVSSGNKHVNSGTQFKSGASRFNTGKQHVNSGSVNVNSGTQFKSGASKVNTGKQNVNTARVIGPKYYKTRHHRIIHESILGIDGIFNSGCSGHMTGNRGHLEDYQNLLKVRICYFWRKVKGVNQLKRLKNSLWFLLLLEKQLVLNTMLQRRVTPQKKPSSTPISKSADDIMVFRKELDALALKHLGPVPTKTPTSTNPVNTGGGNVNTGNEQVSPGHIEAVSPSAHNVEEVFSDDDDDEMPEIRIYDKSSEGIFEQASYDDDGVITDFNNLPDEVDVITNPTLRIQMLILKVKSLEIPIHLFSSSSLKKFTVAQVYLTKKSTEAIEMEAGLKLCKKNCCSFHASTSMGVQGGQALFGFAPKPLELGSYFVHILREAMDTRVGSATLQDFIRLEETKKDTMSYKSSKNKEGHLLYLRTSCSLKCSRSLILECQATFTPWWTKLPLTKVMEAIDVDVHFPLKDFSSSMFSVVLQVPQEATQLWDYGGCQFLGQSLIYRQCKEQTIVATSTTEADEYVRLGVEKSDARSTWAWKRKCQVSLANWMQFGCQPQPSAAPTPSHPVINLPHILINLADDRESQKLENKLRKKKEKSKEAKDARVRIRQFIFLIQTSRMIHLLLPEKSKGSGGSEETNKSFHLKRCTKSYLRQRRKGFKGGIGKEPMTEEDFKLMFKQSKTSKDFKNLILAEKLQQGRKGSNILLKISKVFAEQLLPKGRDSVLMRQIQKQDQLLWLLELKKMKEQSKDEREVFIKRKKRRRNLSMKKEEDDLKICLNIAPDEDKVIDVESLDHQYPIIFSHLDGSRIDLDREDLKVIYELVMEEYKDKLPEGFDRMLWGDLMIMFNQGDTADFWDTQQDWNLISWKLHSSSGVHTIMTSTGLVFHMFVENRYPLTKELPCTNVEIEARN